MLGKRFVLTPQARSVRSACAVALLSSVLASSATAEAEPPATARAVQVGLGFVYGQELEKGSFNPWGTGIGVAGGYTLAQGIYLGGNFDYFLGEEAQRFEPTDPGYSANYWELMAMGGYDFGLSEHWVLRPKLGAGIAQLRFEVCVTDLVGDNEACTADSETDPMIAPGVSILYLGPSFSLSIDTRYDMIFADEEMANAIVWSFGIGF